jgi:hypothetical protein
MIEAACNPSPEPEQAEAGDADSELTPGDEIGEEATYPAGGGEVPTREPLAAQDVPPGQSAASCEVRRGGAQAGSMNLAALLALAVAAARRRGAQCRTPSRDTRHPCM